MAGQSSREASLENAKSNQNKKRQYLERVPGPDQNLNNDIQHALKEEGRTLIGKGLQ